MKRVFSSHSAVAHAWANQTQSEGTASHVYFKGQTIYSYGQHFPVATLVPERDTVLFTTRSYSNSTAKHKNHISRACSQYKFLYCAHPKEASEGNHLVNLQNFEARAKEIAMKLKRARKPEIYLLEIAQIRDQYTKYIDFFQIKKVKGFKPIHLLIESLDGGREATEKEHQRIEKERKAQERRKKEQAKRDRVKLTEDIAKFRARELDSIYYPNSVDFDQRRDFLRFNAGTRRVETSQRVEIPEAVARKAYKWIKNTIKAGGCSGACDYKILDFEVKYVNGTEFRVGCHLIDVSEADALAVALGWQ